MLVDLKIFGNCIRKRREKLNIAQKVMAEKLNCAQSYIAGLENGRVKNPTLKKLDKIADFLGVHLVQIFKEEYTKSMNSQKP